MNLFLKPVDELGIDDIHIQGQLFLVGRKEPPFGSCSHSSAAKLSRKHARIFEENEEVYLVDLGSMNGTKHNGLAVSETPQKLNHGDTIAFAGMAFTVSMDDAEGLKDQETVDGLAVVLTPEELNDGKPILITHFPFLISKSEGVFFENKERFSSVSQYISRRHAYIFQKSGKIYLEDLSSTNGTYLGDSKIEEEPVELADEDVIAFGNRQLRFKITILRPEQEGTDQHEVSASTLIEDASQQTGGGIDHSKSQLSDFDLEPGTILVDKASPFLDIFCAEGEPQGLPRADEDEREKKTPETSASNTRLSLWSRLSIFFSELKLALNGNGDSDKSGASDKRGKRVFVFMLSATVVAALLVVLVTRESAERDIKRLIAEGQFQQAASIAEQYLTKNPGDSFVIPLAHEALLKATIPQWQNLMDKGDFEALDKWLTNIINNNAHNLSGIQALNLLRLVSEFEQFFQRREGKALTHIFVTEDQIADLVARWDVDADGYRQVMDRISASVSQFNTTHTRLYSQLRTLRSEHNLYGPAIKTLSAQILVHLDSADAEQLQNEINRFIQKYPNVGGGKALGDDLNSYLLIKAAVDAGDPIALKQLADHLDFKTPPFKQKVQSLLVNIPTDDFIAQIRKADQLWATGELDQAILMLETLQKKSETQLVGKLIERFRNVKSHWDELSTSGKPHNQEQLIALHNVLDKNRDAYLWSSLEGEFETLETDLLEQANNYFNSASVYWKEYLDNGGIWGGLRLESTVSDTYRTQAKLLSEAFSRVTKGAALFSTLSMQKSQTINAFEDQVKGEAKRQRKWINDLHLVLDQKTRSEKVSLLPIEQEQ